MYAVYIYHLLFPFPFINTACGKCGFVGLQWKMTVVCVLVFNACEATLKVDRKWGTSRLRDWETVALQHKTQKKEEKAKAKTCSPSVQMQACMRVIFLFFLFWTSGLQVFVFGCGMCTSGPQLFVFVSMLHLHFRAASFGFQKTERWNKWKQRHLSVHQILEAQCIWYLVHNISWTEPEHSNVILNSVMQWNTTASMQLFV